ncbi:MAG: DUF1828 domain-containing protein [Candidatus Methylacidiphilaceae bacterium]
MKTTKEFLSAGSCREALSQFWTEQTDVVETSQGLAIALPLMYPDGWQVQLFVEAVTRAQAVLTDKGRTLGWLQDQNIHFQAEQSRTAQLLKRQLATFEIEQDGFELRRAIHLPLSGLDIHLFGEALVSVSHLVYRYEAHSPVESVADSALQRIFRERQLTPKRNVELVGRIERQIRVDYLVETKIPVACQIVRRRSSLLPYMEQWGFRWSDLNLAHPKLLRAMVYNPDEQEWDEISLHIGQKSCDLFASYFETEKLHDFLDRASHGD